jgi:hypothetical protein
MKVIGARASRAFALATGAKTLVRMVRRRTRLATEAIELVIFLFSFI